MLPEDLIDVRVVGATLIRGHILLACVFGGLRCVAKYESGVYSPLEPEILLCGNV